MLWRGADLADASAHDLRLERVRLDEVVLGGARARGLALADCVVAGGTWSNLDASAASLARVELRGVRATGVSFGEARLTDVLFDECRLDLSVFRHARLERVAFRDCRLEEADFYGATLQSVVFDGSALTGASFDAATFSRSEISGGDLTDLRGVGRLAGVRMAWPDVLQIAGLLASATGIDVVD